MRDIEGYEGLYAVTKDGQVWSYPKKMGNRRSIKGKFLKPWLIGAGYEMVMIWKNLKPKKFLTHRLVAQTYIPNLRKLPQVNHINGNRRDNRPVNLEWCTSKDNIHHAMNAGLINNKGSNHGLSKLTERQVKRIKEILKVPSTIQNDLARHYRVSPSTICDIKHGRMWSHIK